MDAFYSAKPKKEMLYGKQRRFCAFALAGCIINEGMSSKSIILSINQVTNPAINVSLCMPIVPGKLSLTLTDI